MNQRLSVHSKLLLVYNLSRCRTIPAGSAGTKRRQVSAASGPDAAVWLFGAAESSRGQQLATLVGGEAEAAEVGAEVGGQATIGHCFLSIPPF